MIITESVLLLSVGVLGVAVWAYCRQWARDERERARWMDKFFEAANRLADEPDTPVEVLELLRVFGHSLGHKRLLSGYIWHLLSGQAKRDLQKMKLQERERLPNMFRALTPRAQEEFLNAITAWINAFVRLRVITGWLARNILLVAIIALRPAIQNGPDNQVVHVVADVTRRSERIAHAA